MRLNQATLAQNEAAWPGASTWLSANAGSGKTRVLTDRVARLLLARVQPQNILCLTYTKAAATEMQNRLFRRLGDWAMKSDADLSRDLQEMGEGGVAGPERLAEARRLFARAIETPGGLRIQTIHSFCASLLRRFPLEAGISVAFDEIDERSAGSLRAEVVEDLARGTDVGAVDALAAHFSGEDLSDLTAAVVGHAAALSRAPDRDQVLGWFGAAPGSNERALIAATFPPGTESLIARVQVGLLDSSSKNDGKAAEKLAQVDWSAPDARTLQTAMDCFLFGKGAKAPFAAKVGHFPTKDCRAALGESLCEELHDLMRKVEAARPTWLAISAAERTLALYRFAAAFMPAYEAQKRARGWLDFDDLIRKAHALLSDPQVAAWVLFRLDGGLDHILVDEAQDTSPLQWEVIERLAEEFATGRGAREDVMRTIFVVGDKKQSIYSFQGADPEGFDRMRELFRDRLENVGQMFQSRFLEYSFRSSQAILSLVETLFRDVPAAAMPMDGQHQAFHETLPGRVDLWPVQPKEDAPQDQPWYSPVDMPEAGAPEVVLARKLAAFIRDAVGVETIPQQDGTRRPVRAGDFLILVRRRSPLFAEIIRACKAQGLPVAGADRLKLGAELAVRDVGALLSFLATPEDDLSLAAALRSPLFGWSEADLYGLAAGRGKRYLWPVLRDRAEAWPDTLEMLRDLRAQADFLRPYDLIERILVRHDGRRRLLARLGPEAEDGIDQLLHQALDYERREVPSLTGFLAFLETDDVEVKRQLDDAGDQIRVMTVHGAKGLESPIVILPDTAKHQPRMRDEVVTLQNGRAVWKMPAERQPATMQQALDRLRAAQQAERLRLLYVALTRAETWLIVAGAGEAGGETWHEMIHEAMMALEAAPLDTPAGPGLRFSQGDWYGGRAAGSPVDVPMRDAEPAWLWEKAALPPVAKVLSPSDLGGAKVLGAEPDPGARDPLRRGRQVHVLLEHLPTVPRNRRAAVAAALLATGPDPAAGAEAAELLAEAERVLDEPGLAWLFAPNVLSEVDVSAHLPELPDARVHGTIDKLLVEPGRVLAVDFKTNRVVPGNAAAVPDGLLRQMGAYASALAQIFPQSTVETAILWTHGSNLMPLPNEIVREALQSAATS